MKLILSLILVVVSLTGYTQESEYYTKEEIEEMRVRLKKLGYDEAFIKKSLEPYMAKAHEELTKTVFKGAYNKKFQQLRISNCSEVEGDDFCAKYIKINGKKIEAYCTSTSVVVNLRPLDLELGSDVTIEIFHLDGCLPQITNKADFRTKKKDAKR